MKLIDYYKKVKDEFLKLNGGVWDQIGQSVWLSVNPCCSARRGIYNMRGDVVLLETEEIDGSKWTSSLWVGRQGRTLRLTADNGGDEVDPALAEWVEEIVAYAKRLFRETYDIGDFVGYDKNGDEVSYNGENKAELFKLLN